NNKLNVKYFNESSRKDRHVYPVLLFATIRVQNIHSKCVFGLILVLVIAGTLCDHWQLESHSQMELLFHSTTDSQKTKKSFESYEKSSKPLLYEILISFSVKINAKKIFDTKGTDTSIQVFHGIRVLSMLWILIGHSFAFAVQWMTFRNPLVIREVPQNIMSQLLANGTFSVDCFFFISGFLVSYVVMTKAKKHSGKPNIFLFYLHRYLRMTPSMMAVIAFSATLLQYLGSGPQWTESITMFNGWCQKNWWVNGLYLHNFVNTQNMCLSHSWYSAVDMQFYFLSPLILVPLYLKPVLGISLAILALFCSMGLTGYLTLINDFPAVPYINDVVEQAVVDKYYRLLYIKPYCRVGPYLVGILLAYAIYTSQGDIKMKKFYSTMGWIISFVVSLGVLFAMFPANNGNVPEVHIAALYSSTSRTIWALSLSWVTFACITGNGGFINAFLSAKVWVPFSRLTHCAYLVHPIVMAVLYGSREHPFDFSSYLFVSLTNQLLTKQSTNKCNRVAVHRNLEAIDNQKDVSPDTKPTLYKEFQISSDIKKYLLFKRHINEKIKRYIMNNINISIQRILMYRTIRSSDVRQRPEG
ncbi:unnamed protein product, partial [Oppiella nova]